MNLKKVKLSAFAAMSIFAGLSQASTILDQYNALPVDYQWRMFCSLSIDCGQSFRQSESNISGAGIYISPSANGSGVLTISLFEMFDGNFSGLLAQASSDYITNNSGWVDVFWPKIDIDPSKNYFLRTSTPNSNLVSVFSSKDYEAGYAVAMGSNYGKQFDLVFRTYHETDTIPVSEPSTSAMLLTAFGILALTMRRKSPRNSSAN